MKKFGLLVLLSYLTIEVQAQLGYVKLDKDSVIKGYIRTFRSADDGQEVMEIWKTKTDKNPLRISKRSILEYVIKKDTVKVLHNYTPFLDGDLYYELVDATYIVRGKMNMLEIPNANFRGPMLVNGPGRSPMMVSGGSPDEPPSIFILENVKNDRFTAIPFKKTDLHESLLNFFPETFLARYEQKFGKIKYKSLRKFIEFYNSK